MHVTIERTIMRRINNRGKKNERKLKQLSKRRKKKAKKINGIKEDENS